MPLKKLKAKQGWQHHINKQILAFSTFNIEIFIRIYNRYYVLLYFEVLIINTYIVKPIFLKMTWRLPGNNYKIADKFIYYSYSKNRNLMF